jgi:hypothetical protein
MQRNNKQTYMTPAKDKNAQYFAWDFVGRTIVGGFLFPDLRLVLLPSYPLVESLRWSSK